MLTNLTLRNFRGFENHHVPFKPATVIIGKNNAGKSTIVEALRLVSIVASRHRSLGFHYGPEWIKAGRAHIGLQPSLKNMEISFDGMRHHYAEPPSVITATFSEGQSICVFVAEGERIHAVLRSADGKIIKTRQKAVEANFPALAIMPQVSPLQKQEVILNADYVRSSMSSALAPLHFRNQLNVRYDLFQDFSRVVAETWPGVMIHSLVGQGRHLGDRLYLEVRNEDFVGEVGMMGHGLQMWLQTMWFLTLSRDAATVILDEPDVYMHPDLQRRIARYVRNRHRQHIITTHSIEILAEVDPDNVLVIDKRRPQSRFATSVPAVQKLIDGIGSIHNIQISRLWQSRRLVLVEGDDLSILKTIQDAIHPQAEQPIDLIPSMSIGGWGGWPYAIGSAMLMTNAMDEAITTYCILDSDYHTQEECRERHKQAAERGIQLHIWSVKEIENFLLVPDLICRAIAKSVPARIQPPSDEEVSAVLHDIASTFRDDVLDGLATEILSRDRKLALSTANKLARERVDSVAKEKGSLLTLVPGKNVISRLSEWSQAQFGVAINTHTIAKCARVDDFSPEVIAIISAIEDMRDFH